MNKENLNIFIVLALIGFIAYPFIKLYIKRLYLIHFDKSPIKITLYSKRVGEPVHYILEKNKMKEKGHSIIDQMKRQENEILSKRNMLIYKRCLINE